jgi:hypothetical protein
MCPALRALLTKLTRQAGDCGRLNVWTNDTEIQRAMDCALTSSRARRSFLILWEIFNVDS